MRILRLILALLTGAMTAQAYTNFIYIPYSHPYVSPEWWLEPIYPTYVTNWQAWQAENENWRRASNALVHTDLQLDATHHWTGTNTFENLYIAGFPLTNNGEGTMMWGDIQFGHTGDVFTPAWSINNAGVFTGDGSGLTNVQSLMAPVTDFGTNRVIDVAQQTNIWEDLNFQPTGFNPVGVVDAATLVGVAGPAGNMLALDFAAAGTAVALVNPQTSHTWVPGTRLYSHLHICPKSNNDGGVVWKFTVLYADIGQPFTTNGIYNITNTLSGGTNQFVHLLWDLPDEGVLLTNAVGPSTVQLLRIERNGGDSADTYPDALSVINFDVHYRWGGSPVPFIP